MQPHKATVIAGALVILKGEAHSKNDNWKSLQIP